MNDETPVTRAILKAELDRPKAEVDGSIATAIRELKEYIDEGTHDAETRLLRAFGDYQQAQNTRFTRLKADV